MPKKNLPKSQKGIKTARNIDQLGKSAKNKIFTALYYGNVFFLCIDFIKAKYGNLLLKLIVVVYFQIVRKLCCRSRDVRKTLKWNKLEQILGENTNVSCIET